MNTRLLMIAASFFLALLGIATTFGPAEVIEAFGVPAAQPLPVLIQLLGALYFAFALANWTAKEAMIGGIYARPLALGNFLHFLMGLLALAKQQFAGPPNTALLTLAALYGLFALAFGYLVFGYDPARRRPS